METNDISLSAKKALDNATLILARSEKMCAFATLAEYAVRTLDGVYQTCRNFDTLNKKLANAVLQAAKDTDVVYCVDGAVCEDEACKIILSRKKGVTVHQGVSKSARVRSLAKLKSESVTALSAYAVEGLKSCPAAVVYDIDDMRAAEQVKMRLTELFGEETICAFVRGNTVKKIAIYEIDRQKRYGGDCAVAVEEGDFLTKERYDYADLQRMVSLLRAPNGCPWDRVQTNQSITANMVEEAYELVDAVNRGDDEALCEEAGDVLLQAAFHTVMKEEVGAFTGGDVLTGIVKKLIFRHSHIFGKDKAKDENSALNVWDKNKATEKHFTNFGETLLAVPQNFPACMRAQKVQKRASKSGMDFVDTHDASLRLSNEVAELLTALKSADKTAILDECGDVLFSAVNVCRLAGVDCEEALAKSCDKFIKRFVACEQLVLADGKDMKNLSQQQLDSYWVKAKNVHA